MRHVDRTSVPRPSFFDEPEFLELRAEYFDFHAKGGIRSQQMRFPLRQRMEPFRTALDDALDALFSGCCAYSETDRDVAPLEYNWHRPPADATGADGTPSPDHYWWLALDWDNLYLVAQPVASVKSTWFEVAGERAEPPTTDDPTAPPTAPVDNGMLLDPCRDHPEWYLQMDRNGILRPAAHPSPSARWISRGGPTQDRASYTIERLDLNHTTFQESRVKAVRRAERTFRKDFTSLQPPDKTLASIRSHHGTVRQRLAEHVVGEAFGLDIAVLLEPVDAGQAPAAEPAPSADPRDPDWWGHVARWLLSLQTSVAPMLYRHPWLAREMAEREPLRPALKTLTDHARNIYPDLREAGARPQVEAPVHIEFTPSEPVNAIDDLKLTRVRIRNFRPIDEVEFSVQSSGAILPARYGRQESELPDAANWAALLGENGSGKSSIVQAIGLALAGRRVPVILKRTGLTWNRLLRYGQKTGTITLEFVGGKKIDMRFNDRRCWYVGGTPQIESYVRGYGATRMPGDRPERVRAHIRISNLFDRRLPVIDTKQWLLELDDGDFNTVGVALQDLLTMGEEPEIDRRRTRPKAVARNRRKKEVRVNGDLLEDVSDGYQSIIAMACDIMAGLGEGFADMHSARGLVLIDEIGAHLHPRWKMEITRTLRRTFPSVQFVVSTHEPLCLRGLYKGEVKRIEKHDGRVTVTEVDRSPSDYRVDQLLTSEMFGLHSAVDPDLDAKFQEYYRLLALPANQRPDDYTMRISILRRDVNLGSRPALGYTRRDQLVYELIDQFLADRSGESPKQRQFRRAQLAEEVRRIWEWADVTEGTG